MVETADMALTHLNDITPEWLTQRLRQAGYLPSGRVLSIYRSRVFSNNAESAQIEIDYSADSDISLAPNRLFVKVAHPDFTWNQVEFDFYTRLAPEMQQKRPNIVWPFPFCYDAVYCEGEPGAHLLLEDLSTSHVSADVPLPPTPIQAQGVIDGLAAFHGYWWQDSRLGVEVGRRQTAESLEEMIQWARGNFERWVAYMGARLSSERKAILAAVFNDWPALRKERVLNGQGLTLVHRDTHPLNFLYPRDGSSSSTDEVGCNVKIVDWQSWRVDSGTDDLAYMMACHWYPDYRQQVERPLIERYHQQLLVHGVSDYNWELCWYDYRASVIRCLFFLLASWNEKRPVTMWWDRLEKALLAFEDLDCMELLV